MDIDLGFAYVQYATQELYTRLKRSRRTDHRTAVEETRLVFIPFSDGSTTNIRSIPDERRTEYLRYLEIAYGIKVGDF